MHYKTFMRNVLLLLAIFSSISLTAQTSKDKVNWEFAADRIDDTTFNLKITATIGQGFHVFSFNPGTDPSMRPPSFKFNKNESVKLIGKIKENGKLEKEEIKELDVILNYYKNKIVYTQKAIVKANTSLKGTVNFMACDDKMCLPPADLNFSIPFTGVKYTSTIDTHAVESVSTVDTSDSSQALATTSTNNNSGNPPSNDSDSTIKSSTDTNGKEQQSLWGIFITGLISGFVAFVTPCIFSMLPITVSFFTKRSKTKSEGLRNATFYSLSIIGIFSVIGFLISMFFKENTMYVISSSIWFNLFVFAVFLIFGFSLLGYFEITLPSSWSSKLDSKANTSSYAGIFFMALVLVVVSFSCTSAFISWLIVQIVQSHNRLGGIVGFFGFGLALAIPFAFFAYFPGLLNSLAKSGGWLNSVKVTMGFIELALSMKFLSNVDLQYHWHLLNYDVYLAIWITLSVLLGLYLIGKIKFPHDDEIPKNMFGLPFLSVVRFLTTLAAFSFAVYLLPGLFGAPLTGISGLLPERKTLEFNIHDNLLKLQNGQISVSSQGDHLMPVKYTDNLKSELPGITAFFDYEEALAASKKLNKPLLLDFTGHSCINCRKMERAVLSKPEVLKLLQQNFIVASLYCDDRTSLAENEIYTNKDGQRITNLGDKNIDIEVNKYGEVGQPIYIFVDGDGTILKNAGGYVDDVPRFINIMNEVLELYKTKEKSDK